MVSQQSNAVTAATQDISTDRRKVTPPPPDWRRTLELSPNPPAIPAEPASPPPVQTATPGEGGDYSNVSNAEFIAGVFHQRPKDAHAAICTKPGNPIAGGWSAVSAIAAEMLLADDANNYFSCSSYYLGGDLALHARKENFAAFHCLMFDDVGTKISEEKFAGIELSWKIETSPGNYQVGIILDVPITDIEEAERLQDAVITAGLCDPGSNAPTKWARLPKAINGKPEHRDADGKPFQCQLVERRPNKRYSIQEAVDALKLELQPKKEVSPANKQRPQTSVADEVFTPRAIENPVVSALKKRNLYKTPLGSGKHDITCPWVHEHTGSLDTGSAFFEPDEEFPTGGFCCMHSHRDSYHLPQLLEFLEIAKTEARNKPIIRIVAGEMYRVLNAAEQVLATLGRYYQAGNLIVTISTDLVTGDSTILPTGIAPLTRQLSFAASWEKYDGRSGLWVRCDPPPRHVSLLFDAKSFQHLPPLAGIARQPYFRESDGKLVREPGYDSVSKRFGVFDPKQFPLGDTSQQAAKAALKFLLGLLSEFSYVSPIDEAATLSAMFTAVVRVSLNVAPAYHVHASVFASGKSYQCELIAAFAGPGLSEKISYPTSSEEATKVILALLMKNPACVEFDDMDGDWHPFGIVKRMLTAAQISDRVLGYSKTATVSTRTLFLGSGNNVRPVRDLLRRVIVIHLDPRVETPATLSYRGDPVAEVRGNRGKYVMAVMTVIQAWREAGMPRTDVESIASFDGDWSDYCRHPLIWLGLPDPAKVLIEQVTHDPDRDTLKGLLTAWYKAFRSVPTTVRKAVEKASHDHPDLYDALREFPIEERGSINHSKLGWILKKNANRIVGGMEFQRDEADGRTAWKVVAVKTPATPAPASPALPSQVPEEDPF